MTHNSYFEDKPSFKSRYEESVKPPEEILIQKIQKKLDSLKEKGTDKKEGKHVQKIAVLEAAKAFLKADEDNKPDKLAELKAAIDENPRYKESIFKSTTEKLVKQVISVKQTHEEKLIQKIESQLKSLEGKGSRTGKHAQKRAVLEKALEVLLAPIDEKKGKLDELESVIKENPRYKESIFKSTTKELIDQVLDLKEDNSPRPGKR